MVGLTFDASANPPAPTFESLGGWPGVLASLLAGTLADRADEAETVMGQVLAGEATPAQIAALATALRAKGESVEEMTGFVRAMVAHALPLGLPAGIEVVDTCGTGGDRLRSINVSTIAALVVAATGAKVCKHGGRASSSAVGAADVLEALGVVADLGPAGVARCIDEVGMGFCFAPRFHPAMRFAGPGAQGAGHPDRLQLPGPLANPGRARYQVIGVSNPAMADKMLGVLAANGRSTGHGRLRRRWAGRAEHHRTVHRPRAHPWVRMVATRPSAYRVDPAALGFDPATLDDLRGGDAAYNAEAIRRVVGGKPSPHRDIAVLNAAAALVVVGRAPDLPSAVALAGQVIDDGRAAKVLNRLIEVTQQASAEEQAG